MIGFLTFLYSLVCIIIILLILIQKGKSSLGMGGLGGGQQMLFGGSGGQDLFQKATWVLGALLLFGSLGLAVLRAKYVKNNTRYISSITAEKSKKAVTDLMTKPATEATTPIAE